MTASEISVRGIACRVWAQSRMSAFGQRADNGSPHLDLYLCGADDGVAYGRVLKPEAWKKLRKAGEGGP